MKCFGKWQREMLWLLAVVSVTAICCIGVFHLWETDLNVMLDVQEDSIGLATLAKDYISGISRNELLLMPFENVVHSSIDSAFTHRLLLRVIAMFSSSFGLACNILYLLGYVLVAVSMGIVLRIMGIHGAIAGTLGIVYTFLPYHYLRGESHIYLGMYYMVPFSCLIIFQVLQGKVYLSRENLEIRNKRFLSLMLAVILLAITDIYYMVFTCILLVSAGFIKSVWERKFPYFNTSIVLCAVMLAIVIITNVPYLFALLNGEQAEASIINRNLGDLELFALRITQLLLPIQGHRISFLNLIRKQYDRSIPDTESRMVSLGLIMSAGFLISLFFGWIHDRQTEDGKKLKSLGMLNLCCILFSTVGGFQVFIGMISPVIRCYNRMSVFIATFSMMTIAVLLQALYQKWIEIRWKTSTFFLFLLLLLGGGIYDQTKQFDRLKYQENLELDRNTRDMVQQMEDILPKGSLIFMLPALYENEDAKIYQMRNYEQQWPVLYSDSLRWSATDSLGIKDKNRQWKKALSVMETYQMLENVCAVGFDGVWMDENGYDPAEFLEIQKELEHCLGKPLLTSASGKQAYYSLDLFRGKMNEKYSDKELEKLKKDSMQLGSKKGDYYHADSLSFQGDVQSVDGKIKILKKGSIQYGPYVNLRKGTYRLEIYGRGLDEKNFYITKNQGEERIEYTSLEIEKEKVIVKFKLPQSADTVEFIVDNEKGKAVGIEYYYLEETDGKDMI